jgi:predicted short-subunit dehydrogenase-like oxidoreductase (DUF2520 family)
VAKTRKSARGITLVGAGSLARALGPALRDAGYRIDLVVSRPLVESRHRAAALAKKTGAGVATLAAFQPASDIVWLCSSDDALPAVARLLSRKQGWHAKIVLHSSGALGSDVLAPLRRAGASTASLHPMMTFVPGTSPKMEKVSFAVEGERKAVAAAKSVVRALKGEVFEIQKKAKVLYHALGSFSSPLVVATLVTGERVGKAAGLPVQQVAKVMRGILLQTIDNYLQRGPAAAFSGPIKRGDLNTVRAHLRELHGVQGAKEVYRALVKSALLDLPSANKNGLLKLMKN